jgi:hypothetical protein
MKTETFVLEMEELLQQLGYQVRKEAGSFRGNSCVMKGERMVVLNKRTPKEFNAGILARLIGELPHNNIYIKPAVRKELEKMWKRQNISRASDEMFTGDEE